MSLYWPEGKVAIDIVDDPGAMPFDAAAHPDVTVIPVTCAQLDDFTQFDDIARTVAYHLGVEFPPDTPGVRSRRMSLHHLLFG